MDLYTAPGNSGGFLFIGNRSNSIHYGLSLAFPTLAPWAKNYFCWMRWR